MKYKIVRWHGEGKTLFHVVNANAPEDAQPAVGCSTDNAIVAERIVAMLNAGVTLIPLWQKLGQVIDRADHHRPFYLHPEGKKVLDELPHGGGIDCEWEIYRKGSGYSLVNSYHHMNENGMYDGWTEFTVDVKPDIVHGFTLRVVGKFPKRYADTREYLEETLHERLSEMIPNKW